MAVTTLRTAVERLLPEEHGSLEEYVRARRAAGTSWRVLGREVYELTGVDLSHEVLRGWFPELKGRAS